MSKGKKYICDICKIPTNSVVKIKRRGYFNFANDNETIMWSEFNGYFDVCHDCWEKLVKQIKEMK